MTPKLYVFFGLLVLMLIGCGPSAGERRVKTELDETQKKLTATSAESLVIEKARREEAAKFSSESELLRSKLELLCKQLSETQRDLTNSQAKALALQEEIKRNTPPAAYEVTGEIFVVTKGGVNFKLGLVNVQAFEKSVIDKFVAEKNREQGNLLKEVGLKMDEINKEIDAYKPTAEAAVKAFSAAKYGSTTYERSYQTWKTTIQIEGQKSSNLAPLLREQDKLFSGSFFFELLPKPKLSVQSNSDGRFRFSVTRDVEVIIAASAFRTVGNSVERYFWLVPVTRPDGASTEITLGNNNLTSVQGGGSLIHTVD